jgi:hypothetical protein
MESRTVRAGHGWTWITEGFQLFRKSPANWLGLLLVLFAASKLLSVMPVPSLTFVLSVIFVLLMPIFIAGFMEGCRSLERGERLQIMHLACGFQTHASRLVTLGGVSLVGNLLVMMIVMSLGGEAISLLTKTVAAGTVPGSPAPEVQAASVAVARALLIGMLLSLPLLMALWFAPLLVYFDGMSVLGAMKSSLTTSAKNSPAMIVYGLSIMAGMFLAMPVAMALRQPDLALWLLAPVVLPSLYVSYKDLYRAATAPQSRGDSVIS